MNKVCKVVYPGWSKFPVYCSADDEAYKWCSHNGVETFLLSSGSGGYIFQIKSNEAIFVMKWL